MTVFAWLLSLGVIIVIFIRIAGCVSSWFLFIVEEYRVVDMDKPCFVCLFTH